MSAISKRKLFKTPRNSPKATADYDTESEDQNGMKSSHINAYAKKKISPVTYQNTRQKSRFKESDILWGLDAPSGTDSGVCSSDQAIKWSSIQPPFKTKSNVFVGKTSHVINKIDDDKENFTISYTFFMLFILCMFILCLSSGIFYYYICYKVDFLRGNLSYLSEILQELKVVSDLRISDPGDIPTIDCLSTSELQQDMRRLNARTSIIENHMQQLSLEFEESRDSFQEFSYKMNGLNESVYDVFSGLNIRVKHLEESVNDYKKSFSDTELSFQRNLNVSLNVINAKLDLFASDIDRLNISNKFFFNSEVLSYQMIESVFAKHYRDQIGMYDYALGSAGGRIIIHLTSETFLGPESLSAFGFTLFSLSNSPEIVLQPSLLPGNCWPFTGSKGVLAIRITQKILLLNVTIDHVPKEISSDGRRSSAPRDFLIRGITDINEEGIILGQFSFSLDSPFPFQTFVIPNAHRNTMFSLYQYEFLTNHGHPNLTCIYRVRLHGTIISS